MFFRNERDISGNIVDLQEKGFLRTHRSFLVNERYVTKADAGGVMLGDVAIPVSRKYKEAVLQREKREKK